MPFPFGKSQKSPAEIVKSLKENVAYMEKLDAAESKKCEKVSTDYLWLTMAALTSQMVSDTDCFLFSEGCRGGLKEPLLPKRGPVWDR